MKINSITKMLVLGILFMLSSSLFGQVTLQGIVTDSLTQEPLIGASILVVGTSQGAATNFDGEYKIQNITEGNHKLRVSYVGYLTKIIDLPISGKKTIDLFIQMSTGKIEGKTIVVTAQAQGQLSAINEQLSSNKIINVVSAEKMKELPDANLAESIGRLPGVSLQRSNGEAEKVVVRGLSPKYNNVTIEGVPLQSTNYYDRSIDLSLIGDDLVKGVEVSKSLRPDMDPDALGGTVNLTLKTAQEGLHYDIRGNGGYNQLGKSYENYKFSGSVSNRFFDNMIGVQLQGNIEEKQLPSDQFSASYATPQYYKTASDSGFNMNTSSATVTESKTTRHRYGVSLMLDYMSEFVDIKFLNVYDQKKDDVLSRGNTTNFTSNSFLNQVYVSKTKTEQRTHSLQALFKFWDTELPISLSYTKGEANNPFGQQYDFLESGGAAEIPPIPQSRLIYGQPSALMASMGVEDPVYTTLNQIYRITSNLTDNNYDAKIDWKIPFKLSDSFTGKVLVGGKYHETDRTSETTQLYYNVQYGGSQDRRRFLVALFPYLNGADIGLQGGIEAKYFVDPNYNRTDILGYNIGHHYDAAKLTDMQTTLIDRLAAQYYMSGSQCYTQDYKDKEKTVAGYLMGEFNVGSDLVVVPGIRFQQFKTDISAYHIEVNGSNQNGLQSVPVLTTVTRTNPYWFPSVNVKYKASENVQIISAVYRSVSLPSYGDISPMVVYNPSGNSTGKITTSNPFLKPSTAWNFDLGTSVFSNEIGLFSVNVFYKEITDLIYSMQNYLPYLPYQMVNAPSDILDRLPNRNYFDTTFARTYSANTTSINIAMNNPDRAFIRGIELSWQTHLWYLPGVLNGIVLDLNVSFMSSSQYYPYFEQVQTGGTKLKPIYSLYYETRKGKMQDQPKAIYNAILGWDYLGFSSRFSLRYQQTTLTSLDTKYSIRDSYYDNVLLIDISLKQKIMDNLAVFVNATNINTHIDDYYLTIPAGTQLPTSKQTYGWNAQIGVSYGL
jgi:TonB-dependent receptor